MASPVTQLNQAKQYLLAEDNANATSGQAKSCLKSHISQILSGDISLQESTTRKTIRVGLEIIAMMIVVGARIGMTMICISGSAEILGLPTSHPATLAMGITNAMGAIVAFGFLSAFSKLKIIEAITRYISPQEAELTSDKMSTLTLSAIKVVSVVLGFLAQVPIGYAAYKSALFAPLAVGILSFADGGRASYSTYMTLKGFFGYEKPKTGTDEKLVQARGAISKRIGAYQRSLLTSDKNLVVNDKQPGTSAASKMDFNLFSEKILSTGAPGKTVKTLNACVKYAVETFVGLMTFSILAEFYGLAQDGAKDIDNNRAFRIVAGVLVALANTYLWYTMIRKSTFFAIDLLRGNTPPSLTRKLMPNFYKRFTQIGSFFAIPTFVPSVFFAKLYFPNYAYYPIAVLASLATFFGGLSALHGLRDIIIIKCEKNNPLAKQHGMLGKVSEIVSHTNIQHIAEFLSELPDNLRSNITDLTTEQLTPYFSKTEKV